MKSATPTVKRWSLQSAAPVASLAAAPIAARSAPILMVLATNSRRTSSATNGVQRMSPMLLARPLPVTRPICALMSWTAAMSG